MVAMSIFEWPIYRAVAFPVSMLHALRSTVDLVVIVLVVVVVLVWMAPKDPTDYMRDVEQ